MENILISVIMPAYNEEIGIRDVLDNYLKILPEDAELIIVDDGSTDNTYKISDAFSKMKSNIRVFTKKNEGCVYARKFGIKQARGTYITFVDADDYIGSDYFDNIKIALTHKADYYLLNNQLKTPQSLYVEKDFVKEGYQNKSDVYQWILSAKMGAVWDKIFISSLLKNVLGKMTIKMSYGEDVYINLLYLEEVDSIFYQDSFSYIHVVDSETSICTKNVSLSRIYEIDSLYRSVISMNIVSKLPDSALNSFRYMCLYNLLNTIYLMDKKQYKCKEFFEKINKLYVYNDIIRKFKRSSLKDHIMFHVFKSNSIILINMIFHAKNLKKIRSKV